MRRLPPLSAVRVFEAAARHENFTTAAAELGMTQAAVSYQVKALEERIGTALFVRERGRARLTPTGARLAPTLRQALDSIANAFASVRAEDEGLLTLTTTHSFANTWLVWRLGAFQLDHPDLALRLDTSEAMLDLAAGEADAAIRAGRGEWPGMAVDRLMAVDFTPMCSPAMLAFAERQVGRALTPADLPHLPLLNPQDRWWETWLGQAGVDPGERDLGGGLRLDSQVNEGQAAMSGQGFALLTPALWRKDVAEGRLVRPFDQVSSRGFGYWLVIPEGRRSVPKIKRFREWLLAAVARAEPPQPEGA